MVHRIFVFALTVFQFFGDTTSSLQRQLLGRSIIHKKVLAFVLAPCETKDNENYVTCAKSMFL